MPQFVIKAKHPPELCPTSNAKIRQLMKEVGKEIPKIAEKLGVKIITLNVFGPEHEEIAVVEAENIEAVRSFTMHSRLVQWNTVSVHATWTMEEAMAKADDLQTIF